MSRTKGGLSAIVDPRAKQASPNPSKVSMRYVRYGSLANKVTSPSHDRRGLGTVGSAHSLTG
jgi:hypothetical protein